MPAPTRRGLGTGAALALLGASAAQAAAGVAGLAPEADAELIRLCVEHDALERELYSLTMVGTIEAENGVEAATSFISTKQLRIADQIGARPPTSAAGWRALAGTIALMCPEAVHDEQDAHDSLLMATLLQGLLGRPERAEAQR